MESKADRRFEIQLLGRFSVRIDGRDVSNQAIEGRKARSLLKLIALQRNFQLVRDQAMNELWGELSQSSAAAQLYKAIHRIRKALSTSTGDPSSEDLVVISDEVVSLAGAVVTDVQRFEASSRRALATREIADLETAASLYTGDLLPADLYSDWTALPRAHLLQLYLDVLLALGEQYQRTGRWAHAAETFRLALRKDPLLEVAHRSLMRVFAVQGQTTRAIRQFETCRQVLLDELEAEPEAETVQLNAAIQEKRIAGRAVASESIVPLSLPALVNRTAECRLIETTLERLAAGRGSVMIVEGAVGVGKTRLVQEAAGRGKRHGFTTLTGTAREMEGMVAYGPFIEILDAALRERSDAQHLIPQEIAASLPSHTGTAQPVPNTDRRAAQGYLFAQIHQFFRQFSAVAPTVLIIEDLHAADDGTLELFQSLARQTANLPLLVIATVRNDQGANTEHVRNRYREVARETALSVISLDPLSEKDHVELLEQLSGPRDLVPGIVEQVYSLSEGNPLFAIELHRVHSGDGSATQSAEDVNVEPTRNVPIPPSLSLTVGRRLEKLSPGARHLLYLMTVLGREIEFELLETAWNGGQARGIRESTVSLFDLLDELLSAGLVEEHGLRVRFLHGLVRASIYQSISEARRIALHTLAARSLIGLHPDEEKAPVEQIAFHFGKAGEPRQAAHYLVQAGQRAESVYAHEEAFRCFEGALEQLKDSDDAVARRTRLHIYRRIGDVYRASGRLEQSYDAYQSALDIASSFHLSRAEEAAIHLDIALVAIFRTEMGKSERHLDAAWELTADDERGRTRVLILRALHLWHLNELDQSYRTAREALDLAESIGASFLASQACEILAMACLPLGRWEEGLSYEKRRQVHGWSPDVVVATDAHLCLWEYHVSGERPFEEASTFMKRVSAEAARLGDYRCVAVCHYALGTMHLWRGDSEKAREELDASLELHGRVGSPAGVAYALARKAVMHTMQGALDLGWNVVCEGIEQANTAAVRDHCLQRLYGIGLWNRLEAHDMERAAQLVAECEALLEETPPCSACALELYPWLAFYYLSGDNVEGAESCSDTVNAFAETTGNPIARIISKMVNSSVMAARQDHQAATDLRSEALLLAGDTVVNEHTSPVRHFLDRMIDQQARY